MIRWRTMVGFCQRKIRLLAVCINFGLCCSLPNVQDSSVDIDIHIPANGSTTPDTRPSGNPFISHTLDSSIPTPTQFAWSAQGNDGSIVYDMSLSEDSIFTTTDLVAKGLTDTMLSVWNLKINTLYYWKISIMDGLNNVGNTSIFSFTTSDAWPRMIYIDGTTNVRDIGGRRNMDGLMIRQGIFYRSAEFNQTYIVTPKGIAQLKQLGIVFEIDLRNSGENPLPLPLLSVRYMRPITDSGAGIAEYKSGLVSTPQLYRDVFKEIANSSNYPLICHCRLGADRTGTVVALLEAILGCSEQQMGEDYVWTSLSIIGRRDTASQEWRDVISYLKSFDNPNSTIQAGAWNYLQVQGMTVDELIAIRKIFLDDDHQPFPALGKHIGIR
jgi:protein-tyrosine phosphatase